MDAQRNIKAAQTRTSQYLEIVENEIARSVSSKAESFFSVVNNHDVLQERMNSSLTKIANLKASLTEIRQSTLNPGLSTLALIQVSIQLFPELIKYQ